MLKQLYIFNENAWEPQVEKPENTYSQIFIWINA